MKMLRRLAQARSCLAVGQFIDEGGAADQGSLGVLTERCVASHRGSSQSQSLPVGHTCLEPQTIHLIWNMGEIAASGAAVNILLGRKGLLLCLWSSSCQNC
jgi:hypothetical protein